MRGNGNASEEGKAMRDWFLTCCFSKSLRFLYDNKWPITHNSKRAGGDEFERKARAAGRSERWSIIASGMIISKNKESKHAEEKEKEDWIEDKRRSANHPTVPFVSFLLCSLSSHWSQIPTQTVPVHWMRMCWWGHPVMCLIATEIRMIRVMKGKRRKMRKTMRRMVWHWIRQNRKSEQAEEEQEQRNTLAMVGVVAVIVWVAVCSLGSAWDVETRHFSSTSDLRQEYHDPAYLQPHKSLEDESPRLNDDEEWKKIIWR